MVDMNRCLKALGDETRLKIIKLLLSHDLCVGAIAHRLKISKPAVSQHLQVLRRVGLVRGEKRGYWTHYSVERDLIREVADELKVLADTNAAHRDERCGDESCCSDKSSGNGEQQ